MKQKPIASIKKYDEVLWVSKLPDEAECQDAFRNKIEDWLYVKKPVHPAVPAIPDTLQDWVIIDYKKYTFNINNSITKEIYENEETIRNRNYSRRFPYDSRAN